MTTTKNPGKVTRITSRQAAQILKDEGFSCNEDTITRWCRNGVLKKAKKVGGQWYVNEEEVREMIE